MDTQRILFIISGVLFVVGFIPYIISILRGNTKPAKASWIIWAGLDTLILIGMYAKHSVNGQIIGAVIGAWMVAILSLKYGVPGWTRLDKFCIIGTITGIALWKWFEDPTLCIISSLIVGFIGAIPTFVSAWYDPNKEDKIAWTIFWISCVLAVVAIPRLTFEHAGQPIVFCLIESIVMFLLFIKPKLILN